ncbi:MAG TPA: hypothetical protein VE263_03620 [Candidatus Angelobacter sp.]|nr:hypothetical protein [Candidatus Angelobacter sp.]
MAYKEESSPSISLMACLLFSLGLLTALAHILKLSGRTLIISDDRIAVRNSRGNEIGNLYWSELGRVSERRKMAQLALWDKSGRRRVLVDKQFENFRAIRSRILDEYSKVFALQPLPIQLRNSSPMFYESFIFAGAAAFFSWVTWRAYQEGLKGLSAIPLCFSIGALFSLLGLYPQLGGPSELLEDRIVLRSLFRRQELYKTDVTGVELGDVANPRSGTKFSLVTLKSTGGNTLKITSKYGSIPEIYLTLRAWLAQK